MSHAQGRSPLRYARPPDLGRFCRPVPQVMVLDTQDVQVGIFDGLVLQADSDRPLYLVIRRHAPAERRLLPVGSAWFDQTTRAIRVDPGALGSEALRFDPGELDRMSAAEVVELERGMLMSCCPEELRDGWPPSYEGAAFKCPQWLKM